MSRLLTMTQLAAELGRNPKTIAKLVNAGAIPPAYVDDNGRKWFSMATIEAAERRAGELHAERRAS